MAIKVPQASFAKGELDPQLMKRVSLAAYDSGLATARNACISLTGSIFSRAGRKFFERTYWSSLTERGQEVVGFSPPGTQILIEFGHNFANVINFATGSVSITGPISHSYTLAQIKTAHFESSGNYVYVFIYGQNTLKLDYVNFSFVTAADVFAIPLGPGSPTITPAGTPSGHYVDYILTRVINGQESAANFIAGASTYKLPISAGQSNSLDAIVTAGTTDEGVTEMRVYRRPQNGGSFGYIGSTSYIYSSGGNLHATFIDFGQEADYSISQPVAQNVARPQPGETHLKAKTGVIYQQRLLLGGIKLFSGVDLEGIVASKVGAQNYFYDTYPLNDECALRFKAGSSGAANVRRMIDADGLVVFTNRGVFLHSGLLSPDNPGLAKKGKWKIKEDVPPLAAPGGLFFVDEITNTIRNLVWLDQIAAFNAKEISVYSNHLFKKREISSWGFHEGKDPVLFVVFDDGKFATFTYEFDQEMRAWTRGDSQVNIKQIIQTEVAEKTFFLCEKNGTYWWEVTVPRWITGADLEDDSEAHMGQSAFYADSMITYNGISNAALVGADEFTLEPLVEGDWTGSLYLRCGTSGCFAGVGGTVGEVYRVFDPDSFVSYDLTITQKNSNNELIVIPDREYDASLSSGFNLYFTANVITGLSHFEGEYPAVMVDGEVVCSPNNDRDDYDNMQVSGGQLILPNSIRGAIVHVGRPIVGDIGTLKVTTVEQAPTQHESLTVNKVYIDVLESRGLYIAPKFPDHDRVATMQPIEDAAVNYNQEAPVVPNRYDQPKTRTYEVTLPGEWDNGGEIALRQVDPVHFHITAISLDVDVERRSDR